MNTYSVTALATGAFFGITSLVTNSKNEKLSAGEKVFGSVVATAIMGSFSFLSGLVAKGTISFSASKLGFDAASVAAKISGGIIQVVLTIFLAIIIGNISSKVEAKEKAKADALAAANQPPAENPNDQPAAKIEEHQN
jgi:hypothetical protein